METYLHSIGTLNEGRGILRPVSSGAFAEWGARTTRNAWQWVKWTVVLTFLLFGGIFIVLFLSNFAYGL